MAAKKQNKLAALIQRIEYVEDHVIPPGVFDDLEGATVTIRQLSPRDTIELGNRQEDGEEDFALWLAKKMIHRIEHEGERLERGDIDVEKLPGSLFQHLATLCVRTMSGSEATLGEGQESSSDLQSAASTSTPTLSTSTSPSRRTQS